MATQMTVGTQDTELHEVNWSVHWNSPILDSLLKNPSTHDVTFKTSDGGTVGAHRVIVAASSPVLCDKLYTRYKPLTLDVDVEAVTLSKLLTFIYTGKVTVNSTCLDKMLHAACCFEMISLETILMKFAENSLNVNNIISVTILAYNRNCEQLQRCCQQFIGANMSEVVRLPNFIALPHTVILEVCKSSDLNISEIDLFLAVVEWYKHQTLSETVTNEIFQEIRYPLISGNDLLQKVRPTNLADSNLYKAALEYHINSREYQGPSNQLEKRKYPLEFLHGNESVSTTALPTSPPIVVAPDTSTSSVSENKSVIQSTGTKRKSSSRSVTTRSSSKKSMTQPSVIISQEVAPIVSISLPVLLNTSSDLSGVDLVTSTPKVAHSDNVTRSDTESHNITAVTASTTSSPSTSQPNLPTTSSLNTSQPSTTSTLPTSVKRVNRKRCHTCTGCRAEKCGECTNCINPHRNKVCKKRRCLNLK